MSQLKHIKNTVYRLKQRMGLPIAYHVVDNSTVNVETGEKDVIIRVINIKKAVVLNAREYRTFVYDIAYLSANKDFTTGGFFDPEDRHVILQASDLEGHNPQIWDYVVFQNVRYDIKEIKESENNYGYEITIRKIRGQRITRIVTRLSGLILTDEASAIVVDRLIRDASNRIDLSHTLVENP